MIFEKTIRSSLSSDGELCIDSSSLPRCPAHYHVDIELGACPKIYNSGYKVTQIAMSATRKQYTDMAGVILAQLFSRVYELKIHNSSGWTIISEHTSDEHIGHFCLGSTRVSRKIESFNCYFETLSRTPFANFRIEDPWSLPQVVLSDDNPKMIVGFGTPNSYLIFVKILLSIGLSDTPDEILLECASGAQGVSPRSDELLLRVERSAG